MAHYLMRYKGRYRILPVLDEIYHDIPRDAQGNIQHEDVELYISCQNGNKITEYGKNSSNRMMLTAYIPSIGRGRNIRKALDVKNIPYTNYMESDEEVWFRFEAKYIDTVAELLKAKTMGADISPFSSKNLGKRKDVAIPEEGINKYKNIVGIVGKKDLLIISRITNQFLLTMQKSLSESLHDRNFDIKTDMKKLMLSRQAKEYIYLKNFWSEYLMFLEDEIKKYYQKGS